MDTLFTEFLTIPMVIFCLVISVLVWTQKRTVELTMPKLKCNILWRDLILPLSPAATGGVLGGLMYSYPFPEPLSNLIGRIFCGIACGLASGTVYRILKKFLAEKLGVASNIEDDTLSSA